MTECQLCVVALSLSANDFALLLAFKSNRALEAYDA